jgi:hypothetical protein
MQPKLKPPGTKRFKVSGDILLSTSAFKVNLRRYNPGTAFIGCNATDGGALALMAGANTHPHLCSI